MIGGPDPYWTSYTYDPIGNRTSQTRHGLAGAGDTTTTYTYPTPATAQPHTLTSCHHHRPRRHQHQQLRLRPAGNTTTRTLAGTDQTLTWDPEGHLATLTVSGQTTSYVYDADGNRLLRRDPDGTTTAYLGGHELTETPAGTITATRYYTPQRPRQPHPRRTHLARRRPPRHRPNRHQPTTLATTTRRTMPFGDARGTPPAWPNDNGFVGGTTDPTGLTHLGAREYDPTSGRFISVDSVQDLADPQQWNGYAYANNNPVTASDATGQILCADEGCNQTSNPKPGGGYTPPAGKPQDSAAACAPLCGIKTTTSSHPTPNPSPWGDSMAVPPSPPICDTVSLNGTCLTGRPEIRQNNIEQESTQWALRYVSLFGSQADCLLNGSQIVCFGVSGNFEGRPMTIGDVMLYPGSRQAYEIEIQSNAADQTYQSSRCNSRGKCLDGVYYGRDLKAHEAAHSDQWARSATFLIKYANESVGSLLTCGDMTTCNGIEMSANPYHGSYRERPQLINGEFHDPSTGAVIPDGNLRLR